MHISIASQRGRLYMSLGNCMAKCGQELINAAYYGVLDAPWHRSAAFMSSWTHSTSYPVTCKTPPFVRQGVYEEHYAREPGLYPKVNWRFPGYKYEQVRGRPALLARQSRASPPCCVETASCISRATSPPMH